MLKKKNRKPAEKKNKPCLQQQVKTYLHVQTCYDSDEWS